MPLDYPIVLESKELAYMLTFGERVETSNRLLDVAIALGYWATICFVSIFPYWRLSNTLYWILTTVHSLVNANTRFLEAILLERMFKTWISLCVILQHNLVFMNVNENKQI